MSTETEERVDLLNEPDCAVAKIGDRWFWCTWRTFPYHDPEHPDPVACGYEDTQQAAQERARAEALRIGADPAVFERLGYTRNYYRKRDERWHYLPWCARYAREWHSVLVARRRKPNHKAAPRVQTTQYIYHPHPGQPCGHRILKKTRKKIFIEENCHGYVDEWGGVKRVPAFALDREKLERGESVRRHWWWNLSPETFIHRGDVPECFSVLGLEPPCTAKQVKAAFRKLCHSRHPDSGGTGEGFMELQKHYRKALGLVE